jgi:predicted nucleic acid-binding protein
MVSKKISLYLDTSVIGGYYDEFMSDTRLLFEDIKSGKYDAFISDITKNELENAPENVKKLLDNFEHKQISVTNECESLADEYIKEKVVGKTNKEDYIHIATVTINNIDVLVSWNFKHIVNIQQIRGYNTINMKNGYRQLDIRSPKEVIFYEQG